MSVPFLEIDQMTMRFGGLSAVNALSFNVDHGVIHGLIGPNGAGKTTTFNVISGFYTPTEGRVRLRGEVISGLAMHEVARRGVVRTFQHSTLFAELTVLENACVGTHLSLPAQHFRGDRRMGCREPPGRTGAGRGIARFLRASRAGERARRRAVAWPSARAGHGRGDGCPS